MLTIKDYLLLLEYKDEVIKAVLIKIENNYYKECVDEMWINIYKNDNDVYNKINYV